MESTCGEKEKRSPRIVGESAVDFNSSFSSLLLCWMDDFIPSLFATTIAAGQTSPIPRRRVDLLLTYTIVSPLVGLSEFGEVGITTELGRAADSKTNNDIIHNPSDLDHFMHFHVHHLRLPVLCSVCFQGTYIFPVFTQVPFENLQEAYCMALCNIKKGIEEAQQEYASFIKATYVQLGELTHTNYP
ncbi:hypothetical protein CK203_079367 [Vitis vinifera]|uniref:Uncharacterized protein n=1 Tax=Vitis vinifera TaxID=29760 RepID=A0A438DGM1_VITVI|nr:hypothetical protein CK203_079367 [Vitis vinifera]